MSEWLRDAHHWPVQYHGKAANVDHSADANLTASAMERRKFLLAGGSIVTAALLGRAEGALAHDGEEHDLAPDLVIATVAAHESSRALRVTRLDNGARIKVATTPGTALPGPAGRDRAATDVAVGETVVVVAPEAGAAAPDRTVTAERVVHCNFGVWADAARLRGLSG
jgi:hypothetical protein